MKLEQVKTIREFEVTLRKAVMNPYYCWEESFSSMAEGFDTHSEFLKYLESRMIAKIDMFYKNYGEIHFEASEDNENYSLKDYFTEAFFDYLDSNLKELNLK